MPNDDDDDEAATVVFWRRDDVKSQQRAAEVLAAAASDGSVLTEMNAVDMQARVRALLKQIDAGVDYGPNDDATRNENAKLCAREAVCLLAVGMLTCLDAERMLKMAGLDEDAMDTVMERLGLLPPEGIEPPFPATPAILRMKRATFGPRPRPGRAEA